MTPLFLREFADFVESELGGAAAARLRTTPPGRADLRELAAALAPGGANGELLRRFGCSLFGRLATLYPALFCGARSWRELLLDVAPRVHAELQALQPDAELPVLCSRRLYDGRVEVEYRSPRDLEPLAEGLLLGCLDYFGATGSVTRQIHPGTEAHVCRFIVRSS